jgi:hypothetical protein
MKRGVLSGGAASGGGAARLRRAAAPQNTADSYSETLCIQFGIRVGSLEGVKIFSGAKPAPGEPLFLFHPRLLGVRLGREPPLAEGGIVWHWVGPENSLHSAYAFQ